MGSRATTSPLGLVCEKQKNVPPRGGGLTHHSPDGALKFLGAPARCQGGPREPSLHPSHRPSREGGSISTAYGMRKRGSGGSEAGGDPAAEPRPSLSGSKGRIPPAPPPPGLTSAGGAGIFTARLPERAGLRGTARVGRWGGRAETQNLRSCFQFAARLARVGRAARQAAHLGALSWRSPRPPRASCLCGSPCSTRSAPGPFLYLTGSRTSLRSRFLGPGL